MLWEIKYGKIAQDVWDRAKGDLDKVPPRLRDAPELEMGLSFYYRAFGDLSTCRSIGMGAGEIPVTAIFQYAAHYGLLASETEDLKYIIRGMDAAFLEYHQKPKEGQ
jgi:hypothetical protein